MFPNRPKALKHPRITNEPIYFYPILASATQFSCRDCGRGPLCPGQSAVLWLSASLIHLPVNDWCWISRPARTHCSPLDMKGCICHFTKWQTHRFISKGIYWLFFLSLFRDVQGSLWVSTIWMLYDVIWCILVYVIALQLKRQTAVADHYWSYKLPWYTQL